VLEVSGKMTLMGILNRQIVKIGGGLNWLRIILSNVQNLRVSAVPASVKDQDILKVRNRNTENSATYISRHLLA
jgi:hypothetical protein